MDNTPSKDRRAHRRLHIRLPLQFHKAGLGRCNACRTMTVNVSTGGVYFETTAEDIQLGDKLALELAVPPGDGRFPQDSKISTIGRVVRTSLIDDQPNEKGLTFTRYGVAAQFEQDLKLTFADDVPSVG